MATLNLKDFRDQTQAIYNEYGARFAGKPRATRRLSEIDALISRLEGLVSQARSSGKVSGDPALASMVEQAVENLEIYDAERREIAKVQAQGSSAVEGSMLATWANLHFGQYFRHFAGKGRATRDLGLLNEMISELELTEAHMKKLLAKKDMLSVREDLKTVRANCNLYRTERDNILAARRKGTPDEKASYLATIANEQFGIYNFHFAGRPRISRRPSLMHRVISSLESTVEQMRELVAQGLESQQNKDNIKVVEAQLATYREEFDQIQSARRETPADQLPGHLGAAANQAMEQYRENFAGKDRTTRDLDLLSRICDEMLDLARQMREIDSDEYNESNHRNLTIVLDNVMLYQNEYEEIRKAQI
jgi:hypothetical protein